MRKYNDSSIPWWIWLGVGLSIILILLTGGKKEITLGQVVSALNADPRLSVQSVTCALSGGLIIDKVVGVDEKNISYLTTSVNASVSVKIIPLPDEWKEIPCMVPIEWGD